jgi:hypothetical protein
MVHLQVVDGGDSLQVWRVAKLTNFMELSLSWEAPIVQPLKNFPVFYGTRRFITIFTRAHQWSLSWPRSIQSIPPHLISRRFILILYTHLHLGLPSGLSFLVFPQVSYMHPSSTPFMLHALQSSSSLTWSFWLYLAKSTSYEAPRYAVFLQSPIMSSFFNLYILLSTLFPNTLTVCVPHLMSETKFHTHTEPQAKWLFCVFWFLCF